MGNPFLFPLDSRRSNALRVRFAFILCVLVLGSSAIWADDSSRASEYLRTDFTIDDGLPDNTVNALTETRNGLLWVGTGSGLASFDGRTFTAVSLRIPGGAPPSSINSLVEGPDGDLWVGADAGIVRIPKQDLNDPSFANSTAFRLGDQQSDEIEVLFVARDGTIWAGTNHGLYRFDGHLFQCVLPSISISRINQALNGRLLLTTGSGFVEYDGAGIVKHPGLGNLFGVHDDQIFDVFQDANGTIWYCTDKGIRSVAGNHVLSLDPYQPDHTAAYRISTGPGGALWVSTGMGIYRIDGGEMWTPAPSLHARGVYAGKDGDLWIGTNGRGLVHLRPRLIRMYAQEDSLPPSDLVMTVLSAQDGRLWVGSNCGLSVFDGSHFRNFFEKDGLTNSCVWSLAEDHQHNLWIGTYGGGLFQYRKGVFTQYSTEQGLASRIVLQIVVSQDDSLWMATPDGVSHMQGHAIRNYTRADGLSSNQILNIHQDRVGTIWVATQAGVDRLASGRFVPVPAVQTQDQVLAHRFVEDSRGNLYTTDVPRGVSRIRNGQIVLINKNLNLMDMVEEPDHSLWFSGLNGVTRIAEEVFDSADNCSPLDYEVFNRADGLNTTQAAVGSPNVALTADGKLWIATVKGLAMIDTSRLPRVGRKPQVFLDGVTSDGRKSLVGNGLVLRPGSHHVELHLAAINLSNPQNIRLQYHMEDVDSDWLDVTSSRVIVYTNVPAGKHRLLVRATDTTGHWDLPQVVYEVIQQPHFYAMPLFEVSAAVAVGLMLVLAYILRVRQVVKQTRIVLEQRQVERDAVARDLHDTFLQGVQGLILRFHTGTQRLPRDHPVRRSFEEALSQSDGIMLEGRSVLSRLRARKAKPESLTEAFASLGVEFQSLSPAHFELIASGRKRDLDTVVQEELQKIGREALFNAYRHAKASQIEVEINFGIFEFRIRVRDNGVGIDPAILRNGSIAGHFGLPGMRERVARIGGRLELWSRPGAGTEIEIRIPGAIAYRQSDKNVSSHWIRRLGRSRAI